MAYSTYLLGAIQYNTYVINRIESINTVYITSLFRETKPPSMFDVNGIVDDLIFVIIISAS